MNYPITSQLQPQQETRRPIINRNVDELNEITSNLVKCSEELCIKLQSVCRTDSPSPTGPAQLAGKCDPNVPLLAANLQDIITRLQTTFSILNSITNRLEV